MIAGNYKNLYVFSYFVQKLRNFCILRLYVLYCQRFFLPGVNPHSCNQVPDNKQIFYFPRFGGVWNFPVEIVNKSQKILFHKVLASHMYIAYENHAFIHGRLLFFEKGYVRENN